jgi:putative oxidoreductase
VRRSLPMILIRTIVGLVFLLEGVLKFVQPSAMGAGRFAAIGLPFPHLLAPLVGCIEIGCGAAILLNFFAGDAAIFLLVVIITALITTKIPIMLGRPLGPFTPAKMNTYGWLIFFHEARLDLSMIFGLLAIAIDTGVKMGRKRRWYQDS